MISVLYVAAGDAILSFARSSSGELSHVATVALPDAASCFCLSPNLRFLYCATTAGFVTMSVCQDSGALTQLSVVKSPSTDDRPSFCATDRTGRFLLGAYYTASACSVHSIGLDDGLVGEEKQYIGQLQNAHYIGVDPSNRFVYVPCVAAINSNGGNAIHSFDFCPATGRLTQHAGSPLIPPPIGPTPIPRFGAQMATMPNGGLRAPGPFSHFGEPSRPEQGPRHFGEKIGCQLQLLDLVW